VTSNTSVSDPELLGGTSSAEPRCTANVTPLGGLRTEMRSATSRSVLGIAFALRELVPSI
jgi:hypothetical protein